MYMQIIIILTFVLGTCLSMFSEGIGSPLKDQQRLALQYIHVQTYATKTNTVHIYHTADVLPA